MEFTSGSFIIWTIRGRQTLLHALGSGNPGVALSLEMLSLRRDGQARAPRGPQAPYSHLNQKC